MSKKEKLQSIVGKDYPLVEPCGKGNYGEVWKAKDNMGRDVAIKFLHPYLPKKCIIEEATKQANVPSTYVVPIYKLDERKGFIVMEYCPESLEKRLKANIRENRRLGYDEIKNIIRACVEGLEEAHRNGVVHGDIKPGNILFNIKDIPKISDFGVAVIVGKETNFLGPGSLKWQPPEIDKEPIDKFTDYFTLGIVVYLLFTNRHPFHYEDPSSLFSERENITNSSFELISPKEFRPEISDEIEKVILQLLSRDKKRYKRHREEAFKKAKIQFGEILQIEPIICSKCNNPNPQGSKFCNQCGNPFVSEDLINITEEIQNAIEEAKTLFFGQYLPKDAIATIDKIIDKFKDIKPPALADCYSLKAFINNSGHLHVYAEDSATEGLNLFPEHVDLLHTRGFARYRLGKHEEAKEDLNLALKLTKNDKKKEQISRLLEEIFLRSLRQKVG